MLKYPYSRVFEQVWLSVRQIAKSWHTMTEDLLVWCESVCGSERLSVPSISNDSSLDIYFKVQCSQQKDFKISPVYRSLWRFRLQGQAKTATKEVSLRWTSAGRRCSPRDRQFGRRQGSARSFFCQVEPKAHPGPLTLRQEPQLWAEMSSSALRPRASCCCLFPPPLPPISLSVGLSNSRPVRLPSVAQSAAGSSGIRCRWGLSLAGWGSTPAAKPIRRSYSNQQGPPFAPSLPLRFASASGRVLPAPLRRAWHCGNSFLFCSPAILAAACGEWAPPSRGFGNAGSPGSCRLDLRFLNFFFSMF